MTHSIVVESHKAPKDILRGSSAFRGIVSSYFSGSLMDTYGVEFFDLLVNLPSDVVSVRDFIEFVIVFQIVGVAPRRTRRDVLDAVLQRFLHLLPLKLSIFIVT
ncbi:hypothetical protein CR513_02230, partial [Mucuna pruriens]